MTKNEVVELCMRVQILPFYQLLDADGNRARHDRREYDYEMSWDRPWTMPGGERAWYDDEASERLQDDWYVAVHWARMMVREWEAAHKGNIPEWAKNF